MGLVKYLIAILLILIPATSLAASTWNSPSCKRDDVNTEIQRVTTIDGDTVTIPTCEGTDGTWASGITVTKNITIQGAGYSSTVITRNGTAFTLTDTSTRITGIGFSHSSSGPLILIAGGSGWRIDHCQFTNTGTSSLVSIKTTGEGATTIPYGLIDNNDFVQGRVALYVAGSTAKARALWAEDTLFGSADTTGLHTIYIEDNTFYKTVADGGNVIDASAYTGMYVARYNTVTGRTQFQVHSLQDANNRGGKSWEIYGNSFSTSSYTWAAMFIRSGTGFVFNNTIGNYGNGIVFDNIRSFQVVGAAGQCNGSSDWDGNELANGWPCRDQIGRGKDTSLWTTENPYPTQASQPAYLWSNIKSGANVAATIHNSCGAWILKDRDYYEPPTGAFDGTTGTGCGTLASRPATCTTGTAYWATNQSCTDMTGMVGKSPSTPISGTLYKCTDTDTWTEYYTPYTYPHPLRTEEDADPTVVSVYVNGAIMTINFSKPITSADNAGFTLDPSGADVTVDCPAVETAATSMDCTISRALVQSETAKYAYTDTKVVDAATNPLANIGATDITGNLTPAEAPTAKLTVNKTGAGCTVTSSPSGISLSGATASDDFDFNTDTPVTLSGWSENGWNAITYGGDCAANGTVTVNAAKECTATCTQVQLFP